MAGRTDPRREHLPAPSCLVLLPVGFALPMRSPASRCALTAPFHPYRAGACRENPDSAPARRYVFCGTVPILADGGCYPPLRPVEPGLSSDAKPTGNLPADVGQRSLSPLRSLPIVGRPREGCPARPSGRELEKRDEEVRGG